MNSQKGAYVAAVVFALLCSLSALYALEARIWEIKARTLKTELATLQATCAE